MPINNFDYPEYYYRIAVALSSIILTFTLFKLIKASFNYWDNIVTKLRFNISRMIKLVFDLRTDFFLPMASMAINKKSVKKIKGELNKLDSKIESELIKVSDEQVKDS